MPAWKPGFGSATSSGAGVMRRDGRTSRGRPRHGRRWFAGLDSDVSVTIDPGGQTAPVTHTGAVWFRSGHILPSSKPRGFLAVQTRSTSRAADWRASAGLERASGRQGACVGSFPGGLVFATVVRGAVAQTKSTVFSTNPARRDCIGRHGPLGGLSCCGGSRRGRRGHHRALWHVKQ